MKTTPLPSATAPAVRFGATHGYRFTADAVELNATFVVASTAAHDRAWALQLWACPSVPARSDALVGHLVAEAALPPIAEVAGEAEAYVVTAEAQPPAGDRDHSMVLVLVARRGGGDFDEVHDVAWFPTRERFVLPRIAGPVHTRIAGDRVRLGIAAIENPRDAANLSGTLSVELWALSAPYSGGNFRGTALAGAVLGTLAGQACWTDLALDLPFTAPAGGESHFVVMLREWTGAGYTTRDFANVDPLSAPTPAPTPAPSPAPTPVAARATTAPVVATTKALPPPPSAKVSLNTATLEQLLAVKGLPRAVAERIVRDRPFASVDDMLRVKGMGEKLLAKIRGQLTP